MKVEVRLDETSQPIKYDNAINTYTKGPFYCIYIEGKEGEANFVKKYPIQSLFDVRETY